MLDGIKALVNGQDVFLEIDGVKIRIKRLVECNHSDCRHDNEGSDGARDDEAAMDQASKCCAAKEIAYKDILLTEIRSLHVKNSDGVFLRLNLSDDAVVIGFDTHHLRDMAKSIILSFMKTEQEIIKKALDSDVDAKAVFGNLKQHVSLSKFWAINKDRMKRVVGIARQQPSVEMDFVQDGIQQITCPVLLKIFGLMNCSMNQFQNLLRQSYFFSIKNQSNSLDRLISSSIREYETKQDFASRMNSHSVLALRPAECTDISPSTKEGKKVEFLPVYPFEEAKEKRPRRHFEFKVAPLRCDIQLEVMPMVEKINFDKKDLVWIRDLSRFTYKAAKEGDNEFLAEAQTLTKQFLESMVNKYGSDAVVYVRRILPTYFMASE